jgi:hypothetical protein
LPFRCAGATPAAISLGTITPINQPIASRYGLRHDRDTHCMPPGSLAHTHAGRLMPASRPPSPPARKSNPHSARGTAGAKLPATSCLGAFWTPDARARGISSLPASKNLHRTCTEPAQNLHRSGHIALCEARGVSSHNDSPHRRVFPLHPPDDHPRLAAALGYFDTDNLGSIAAIPCELWNGARWAFPPYQARYHRIFASGRPQVQPHCNCRQDASPHFVARRSARRGPPPYEIH